MLHKCERDERGHNIAVRVETPFLTQNVQSCKRFHKIVAKTQHRNQQNNEEEKKKKKRKIVEKRYKIVDSC